MKLAIVRQTYNPNGGAERFVSRALNVLAQDTALDVTLIARQWEDAAGWQTLTVNPPFRNRLSRGWVLPRLLPRGLTGSISFRAMSGFRAPRFSVRAMAYMPRRAIQPYFVAAGALGAVPQPLSSLHFAGRSADVYPSATAKSDL